MPKLFDRFRRDDGKLDPPRAIAEGITASADRVWAWVVLPTRSTDELNTEEIQRLTTAGASTLRRHLPTDAEFQFKVQWGSWGSREYRDAEARRIADSVGGRALTPGQEAYLQLGAGRMDDHAFPRRQVLLGIDVTPSEQRGMPGFGTAERKAGGENGEIEAARHMLVRAADHARAWHQRMAESSFRARPATVTELAWSLRRDLHRTVGPLPAGPVASPGQVARIVTGNYTQPRPDHVEVETDRGTSYMRFLVPAETGFPTSEMELPGSEWLKELTIGGDDEGPLVPVEVSIRGRNLSAKEAAARLSKALALAKEQERTAAEGVAQDPPEQILDARAVLPERIKEVRKGTVGMVADNPVWIVEAPDRATLDTRTQSVIDSYGDRGITLFAPGHVQHVLWAETILGDRLRFRDCEQLRPMTTLVGGWFHGGSQVGAGTGPYLGGVIGSTPGPYRARLSDAAIEGSAVTSAFVGQSGSGKSTAVMLSTISEAVYGAFALLTDFKGDLSGVVDVASWFGVRTTTITTSTQASGSMCPFRYVTDPAEAASRAVDNLMLMLPLGLAETAEPHLRLAANRVAERPDPFSRSTHEIIRDLSSSPDAVAAGLGGQLSEMVKDPLARPVAGPPDFASPGLPVGAGLVYMRFDHVRMPSRTAPQSTWRQGGRLSVMLVQAGFAYATYMAGRVKGIPKLVALTELHLITPYDFGKELVGDLARLGRALDVSLLLDTQACAELVEIGGLLDQITTVHAFAVGTDDEANAQAKLLGLEPEFVVRDRQKSWPKGQCEVRDRWGQLAPVAFDYLAEEIRSKLKTDPERVVRTEDAEETAAVPA